jgi:hypothetical protein
MTGKEEARISELREQAAGIGAMIDGCLQTKRNKVVNKDGEVHVSPAHHQIQYRGADGKPRWKSVPAGHLGEVRRLIANGRRYKAIEREYAALVSEASLGALGAPPGEEGRGGRPGGAGGRAARPVRDPGGRGHAPEAGGREGQGIPLLPGAALPRRRAKRVAAPPAALP